MNAFDHFLKNYEHKIPMFEENEENEIHTGLELRNVEKSFSVNNWIIILSSLILVVHSALDQ